MEGKDRPRELPKLQGTSRLLLCLTKCLYGTDKNVIPYSGLCVLKAIVALKRVDLFVLVLIKNFTIKNFTIGQNTLLEMQSSNT